MEAAETPVAETRCSGSLGWVGSLGRVRTELPFPKVSMFADRLVIHGFLIGTHTVTGHEILMIGGDIDFLASTLPGGGRWYGMSSQNGGNSADSYGTSAGELVE